MKTFILTKHALQRWNERFKSKDFDFTVEGMIKFANKNGQDYYHNNGVTFIAKKNIVITILERTPKHVFFRGMK